MIKKLKASLKSFFAEMGLFAGILACIVMALISVVYFPFFLIDYINNCSKGWFGGNPDA